MSVRSTAQKQYQRVAEQARAMWGSCPRQKSDWIATLRNALGMNGVQLAQRMHVTKSAVYQFEKLEREGGVTLRKMQDIAEAMDAKFVYAFVPNGAVAETIAKRAREKAEAIVFRTSGHMALEQQALSNPQLQEQIEEMTKDLLQQMPSDLWDDK